MSVECLWQSTSDLVSPEKKRLIKFKEWLDNSVFKEEAQIFESYLTEEAVILCTVVVKSKKAVEHWVNQFKNEYLASYPDHPFSEEQIIELELNIMALLCPDE